ncbi:DoxX-like family protein [Microbulbifer sp. TRSA005]|uniref:DoxX-like family protein n=1 Tax=unclassified Microbulbifer TaxID=2619833 RepID=UPI00403A0CDC
MSIVELCRWIIGCSWIYHGLMPKLVHIAPLEQKMTNGFGFGVEASQVLTRVAGAGEILFGIVFIVFYRSLAINVLNISALLALMIFVAVISPILLIEAFNPVTTNIPIIALSAILIMELRSERNA